MTEWVGVNIMGAVGGFAGYLVDRVELGCDRVSGNKPESVEDSTYCVVEECIIGDMLL